MLSVNTFDSVVMNSFKKEQNHLPAVEKSWGAVSAPVREVCPQSTIDTISKPSTIEGHNKGKTKSKTKKSSNKPRKRGRPKGKKTTSHPLLKRPKRPLSGYNLFFKDQRNEIIGTDGNHEGFLKFAELAKTIGARWKALDAETRTVYESRGAAEMTKYKIVMKEYNCKVKILNESVKSKTNDSDNGSVSDLSALQEDTGSSHGQVNNQEDETTRLKASETLDNNDDAAQMPLLHTNDSTSRTQDEQTDAQVTISNANSHMPLLYKSNSTSHTEDAQAVEQVAKASVPSSLTEIHENMHSSFTNQDSPMTITQELDQVYTNATSIEVTGSQIATFDQEQNGSCQTGAKSDESDFTFDLIEDVLGFDKNESNVPDASFLVFNSQL